MLEQQSKSGADTLKVDSLTTDEAPSQTSPINEEGASAQDQNDTGKQTVAPSTPRETSERLARGEGNSQIPCNQDLSNLQPSKRSKRSDPNFLASPKPPED